MKQLYANNAKTTLTNAISASDTTIIVVDGSKFPAPAANEFFLITLELDTQVEIVTITARSGNILTVGLRGQEGTPANSFAAGSRVECRVTRDTLGRLSKAFLPLSGVEALVAPKDSYNDGYICSTYDPAGNPVVTVARDLYTWRYLNYTSMQTAVVATGTTTSITTTGISQSILTSGKYLIQFTSGALTGYVRLLTSLSSTAAGWTQVLPSAPQAGDTFEIVKANSSIILEALNIGDDAVIMPLILGGN